MKKRILAIISATTMVVSMLTGCSENQKEDYASENKKVAITLGMHVANVEEQEPVTADIIKAFEAANPDIVVEVKGNDKDEHVKKMKMAAQADELPDIFWMDASVAPELNEAGLLLDLNGFLKEYSEIGDTLADNMKEASQAEDGAQYGLPYQSLVTGIWYNKALFEQCGLEFPVNGTTFEELENMVKVFNENGITPIAQGAKDTYSIWAFLIAIERYGYFDKIDSILAGDEKFNNTEFVKFFEKLQTLGRDGAFPSNVATMTYFQAKESFLAEKTAMFDSGMWDAGELDKTMGVNTGFWWGPTFSDSDSTQTVKMKVSSAPLCVSKAVEEDKIKQEAVYKFLAFYYGEEAAKISYEGSIIPSTNYQVEVDLSEKPAFAAIVEALNAETWISPKAQPDLVLKEAVQAQLYDSIYGTMLGNYTPEEALDKIDIVLDQQ